MKVKARAESCYIFVQGLEMTCPLCGTLVRSGEEHQCKTVKTKTPTKKGKPRP